MLLASTLLGIFYWRHLAQLTRPALLAGTIVGVFLFLGYAFQTTGLKLTTPSKSAFLTGVSTVLVPLLLVVFWKTKIHPWRAVGIALALAGLFLMTVPSGREGLADFAKVNSGDLLTIGCALAFAFQIILLGRATQRLPFEHVAFLQFGVLALLIDRASPLLEHPQLHMSPTVIAAVLVTGNLYPAVGFTFHAWDPQFTP